MGRLTNTDGSRIGYLNFDLSESETSATVILRVRPAIGYSLKAAPADADVQIQARKNGTADAFVDLAASPIDLSALPPEVGVNYDFRAVVIAATLVDVRRLAIFLSVTSAGAVGW